MRVSFNDLPPEFIAENWLALREWIKQDPLFQMGKSFQTKKGQVDLVLRIYEGRVHIWPEWEMDKDLLEQAYNVNGNSN